MRIIADQVMFEINIINKNNITKGVLPIYFIITLEKGWGGPQKLNCEKIVKKKTQFFQII